MIERRHEVPQSPDDRNAPVYLECRCEAPERGGCWCEDDGTAVAAAIQYEDQVGPLPGRARV